MATKPKGKYQVSKEAVKFEGFVARLLYDLHTRDVEWNVFYTRKNGSRRQVDVQYKRGLLRRTTIIECKYRTNPGSRIYLNEFGNGKKNNGNGNYKNGNQKKSQEKEISHLIDEIDERKIYSGAKYSVLVTNAYFNDQLRDVANQQEIELWDRDILIEMVKKRSSFLGISRLTWRNNPNLEDMISNTRKREYEFLKGGPYRN
ncbi:hypothetical protein HOC35_07315 [Candidatus Woesearchaeota archaeon]|jgi:hypothetical protein|nr:hypothetical protein [Candidatus Woesearchaeota archaeon]